MHTLITVDHIVADDNIQIDLNCKMPVLLNGHFILGWLISVTLIFSIKKGYYAD
jgi:hypothetical protein